MASTTHWGDWIKRRARRVGFDTQKELASETGFTPQVVSQWYRSQFPDKIRDRSVQSLAQALRTHPDVIRNTYVDVDPEDAPDYGDYHHLMLEKNAASEMLRLAVNAGYDQLASTLARSIMIREVESYINLLPPDSVRRVWMLCRELDKKRSDDFGNKLAGLSEEVMYRAMDEDARRWCRLVDSQGKRIESDISNNTREK